MINLISIDIPSGTVMFSLVVPTAPSNSVQTILGSVGGLVTPNALFLGSYLVLSKLNSTATECRESNKQLQCSLYTIDLALSMAISFLGNLFIVLVFAGSFYSSSCAVQQLGYVNGSCNQIVLQDSAQSLSALYGSAAKYIFAVGMFFSGQNSMISGTLSGQVIFEGFTGLKIKFWQRLLLTRSMTLIPTVIIAVLTASNAVIFSVINEWINILESVVLPFAMIPAVQLTTNRQVMGEFGTGAVGTLFNYSLIGALIGVNWYLIVGFIFQPALFGSTGGFPEEPWFYCIVGAFLTAYTYLLGVVIRPSIEQVVCAARTVRNRLFGKTERLEPIQCGMEDVQVLAQQPEVQISTDQSTDTLIVNIEKVDDTTTTVACKEYI